jgi:threonine dehydrogenase-like Zn-dependent dehydrogenase
MLGVYMGNVPINGAAMLIKEQSLIASMAYSRGVGGRDFDAAARTLAEHPDIVDTLVTHRFPLADAAAALAFINGRESYGKVLLIP